MTFQDSMPTFARLVFQHSEDGQTWTDGPTLALKRRGPGNPFSTGSVGYNGAGKVDILGRQHSLSLNIMEANTKGIFAPAAGDDDAGIDPDVVKRLTDYGMSREAAIARVKAQAEATRKAKAAK